MQSEKVEKFVIIHSHYNLDCNITQDDIVINVTSPFFAKTDLFVPQYPNNNIGVCFPPLQISDIRF